MASDPYDTPEERAEGCFVGKIANMVLKAFGLSDPEGFCSTYREWHIFLAGIWAGLKAAQFADIPECPPMWEDEQQYYKGGAIASNVAKIYGTAGGASLIGALSGIWLWLNSSGVLDALRKSAGIP